MPCMDRMVLVIEETIATLARTKFIDGPIAGRKHSRATSAVSAADKRHGRIPEAAIRESRRDGNRHKGGKEDRSRVSRAALRPAFALFVGLSLGSCGAIEGIEFQTPSNITLSTPIPGVGVTINFKSERERAVPTTIELGKAPPIITANKQLAATYLPFPDLGFALWVPEGCAHDIGRHFELRPEYSKKLRQIIEGDIKRQEEKIGHAGVDALATRGFMNATTVKFECGKKRTANFAAGSSLNRWPVKSQETAEELKRLGLSQLTLPQRLITVTVVPVSAISPLAPTPSNVLMWTRRYDQAYDIFSIYGDKEKNFLYLSYQWRFEDVEIDGKRRHLIGNGVKAFFRSSNSLYVIDVFALEGSTKAETDDLLRSLESFRFVQ